MLTSNRIALWERRLPVVALSLAIWLVNVGFLLYGACNLWLYIHVPLTPKPRHCHRQSISVPRK